MSYEKTLEACLNRESNQWIIGDALIEECGLPGTNKANNDSSTKLKEAAELLARNGLDYSPGSLRNLRDTSAAWPHALRNACVSWSVHLAFVGYKQLLLNRIKKNPNLIMTVKEAREIVNDAKEREAKREQKKLEEEAAGEAVEQPQDEDHVQHVPDEPPVPVAEAPPSPEVVTLQQQADTVWSMVANLLALAEKVDDKETDTIIGKIRDECAEYLKAKSNKAKTTKARAAKLRVVTDNEGYGTLDAAGMAKDIQAAIKNLYNS